MCLMAHSNQFIRVLVEWGPYNYQKALYTVKHFDLPKSTEKTHARRGLYALWITILCVLDNKDVYMWQKRYTILKSD